MPLAYYSFLQYYHFIMHSKVNFRSKALRNSLVEFNILFALEMLSIVSVSVPFSEALQELLLELSGKKDFVSPGRQVYVLLLDKECNGTIFSFSFCNPKSSRTNSLLNCSDLGSCRLNMDIVFFILILDFTF